LKENDGRGNINSVYYQPNHVIRLNGFTDARRVIVAGSFNNWKENELVLRKTGSGWELPMYLAEGTYTYRFIVDGHWMEDPGNPLKAPNEFGEYNSVLKKGTLYPFILNGYTNASKVYLAGTFNDWRGFEWPMQKTDKGWTLPFALGDGNYQYHFIVDGKRLADPANPLKVREDRSVLIINPNYTFRLKGHSGAKQVFLAGDFNDWSPNAFLMRKDGEDWVFTVNLQPGKYRYKFVVDGKWIIDPHNPLWEQNEHRTGNSVLWIEEASQASRTQ
jgi:1,4-alpha-glucan branching enzyme